MAFKARADHTTEGAVSNKQYLIPAGYVAEGIQKWIYVTADPLTTVDGSAYITDEYAIEHMNPGDHVYVYVVGSISDLRTIQADLAAGITDFGWHLVLENTGTVIDLSDDLFGTTTNTTAGVVTYGD